MSTRTAHSVCAGILLAQALRPALGKEPLDSVLVVYLICIVWGIWFIFRDSEAIK